MVGCWVLEMLQAWSDRGSAGQHFHLSQRDAHRLAQERWGLARGRGFDKIEDNHHTSVALPAGIEVTTRMPVLQHVISAELSHAPAFKTSISCRMTCAETSFQHNSAMILRCALSIEVRPQQHANCQLARASCPARQLHGCLGQRSGQARPGPHFAS